jgi:hypothetical protein
MGDGITGQRLLESLSVAEYYSTFLAWQQVQEERKATMGYTEGNNFR